VARTYKTLGELRSLVRAATGFASSGAVAGANQALVDQKIRLAQAVLYETHDWAHLRRYNTYTLGAGAYLLDYPDDANQDRIKAISVLRGNVWSPPLPRGIPPQYYTTQDNTSWPQRWEPYAQIEFWPKADQDYSVRIFYIMQASTLVADDDRVNVDDNLVELGAIAMAKAHYRHPDAEVYQNQWTNTLIKLKGRSWSKSVFNPMDYTDEPLVKPVVV